MTDLTTLTDLPVPTTDDIIYVVDDPASAKNPRKCSIANFLAINDARTKTLTNTTFDEDATGNSITNLANANIKAGAAIDLSKLATDPLARANHTGTQIASTISDFNAAVQTNRLDQMAVPTADVNINTNKLTGVVDPTGDQDAATKIYVDSVAAGARDFKDSARVATTANITLSGEQTIDGVTTSTDRILVKDQSTGLENGIYVTSAGAWSRSTDADTSAEVTSGLYVWIEEGTANGDQGFLLITDDPITLDTTALVFTQVSGLGQITAGTGLDKTGNTLNVDSTVLISGGALGTPSDGVATNLTGLPLSTGVTGILPDTSMPNLTGDITTSEGAVATTIGADKVLLSMIAPAAKTEHISIAVSDETTALTTGTAKTTFRMPYAFTLTDIRASLTTAPTTSALFTVDVNDGGTSIMTTNKLTIDLTEKTTETAATAPVLTDTALANDAEITIDIDIISGGATEAGLKVYLIGYQT